MNEWWWSLLNGFPARENDGRPLDLRRSLAHSAIRWLADQIPQDRRALIAVFGSIARGEAARDLDLILVTDDSLAEHQYWRITTKHWDIDFNIVSPKWIARAWTDLEWGYWVAEAYVLAANNRDLEGEFRRTANRFWSPKNLESRLNGHLACIETLVRGALQAREQRLPLFERLLTHEAVRATASGLIDGAGGLAYSHRTLVEELRRVLVGSDHVLTELIKGLCPQSRAPSTDGYVALRSKVSKFMRDPSLASLTGYSPGASRHVRFARLGDSAEGLKGQAVESMLETHGADQWLPPIHEGLAASLRSLLSVPSPKKLHRIWINPMAASTPMPTRGQVVGARWADHRDGRLKLIANTGGCKTASCSFCALPAYGRNSEVIPLPETVERALQIHQPRALALYNDGNFLNSSEISDDERMATCQVIARHGVSELAVETIPRFVYSDVVRDVRVRAHVSRLTVAMGLQCVGNRRAMTGLGRPDVDALFDQAIDLIHEAGAEVRLYLLWAFGDVTLAEDWEYVQASIVWAGARNVERVSICPYVPPFQGAPLISLKQATAILRNQMSSLADKYLDFVEILDFSLESCAPSRF